MSYRMLFAPSALIAVLLLATASSRPAKVEPSFAIVDVSVVDMVHPDVQAHRTVVVAEGRIAEIADAGRWTPPAGMRVIDGRGLYVMPGLVDAHVHLMDDSDLGQFLAAGVTSIRILMGSPHTLELRQAVATATILGPRITSSGPIFADARTPWTAKVVPPTPDSARALVRAQKAAGYDLIKVYDGLTQPIYDAILDEARRVGLRVTGHIPQPVHLAGILAAKQDIEHTDKIVFDVWGHAFDSTRIDSVARAIAAAGVTVTPTIATMTMNSLMGSGSFDSLLARPATRRASKDAVDFWCGPLLSMKGNRAPPSGKRYNPWADFQMKVIAAERRAGVPMLAGTDYPNSLLAAGTGLVDELLALQESGLTAAEALAAATRNPAKVMGDPRGGVVAVGAPADLVLLGGNPLEDLARLREVRGVSAAGRWLTAAQLDSLAPPRPAPLRCG